MSDGVTLRRAGAGDADAMAHIAVRTWQHAYVDLVDPRTLAERTVEAQRERWRERLAGDGSETVVACVGARVAGYATVGPAGDADATSATGSLLALYVDPSAQGAGLGSALLDDAIARLRDAAFGEARLWTFAAYGLARRFYEGRGWALDPAGAGHEDPSWRDPAVRYRRDL